MLCITNIDLPGTTADPSYTYNGLDTRVGQVISGNTTSWKRSGAYVTDSVLNEGSVAFTPGVSSRAGSTSTFTHAGLKNTERQSQNVTMSATRQYDALGNQLTSTGTWNTCFGYAGNFGYQDDNATGLNQLGHRTYDPSTGRFLTRDPIKDGRNWYGYASNNSTRLVDPNGLDAFDAVTDFAAGMGDMISAGGIIPSLAGYSSATEMVREGLGVGTQVDMESSYYGGGQVAETVTTVLMGPGAAGRAAGGRLIINPGGAGPIPPGSTVIGRDMNKIKSLVAAKGGGTHIDDWLAGRDWSWGLNLKFMVEGIMKGRSFVDVGRNGVRGNIFRNADGWSAYLLEWIITRLFL